MTDFNYYSNPKIITELDSGTDYMLSENHQRIVATRSKNASLWDWGANFLEREEWDMENNMDVMMDDDSGEERNQQLNYNFSDL